MRALTVAPGVPGSLSLSELHEPSASAGPVLVQGLAVGLCGTDLLIAGGHAGSAPEGSPRLIVGHESLGRVLEAPPTSGLAPGMLVSGLVRLPAADACGLCRDGEADMCVDGQFTERGIDGSHGFAAERWRTEVADAVVVSAELGRRGVLLEPASVVAKAWEHALAIGSRSSWRPRTVAVIGAGTIGLLAVLTARHAGLDVVAVDIDDDGPRGDLVEASGGSFLLDANGVIEEADLVFECSGAPDAIAAAVERARPNAVVGLIGIPEVETTATIDAGRFALSMVQRNGAVFGTCNANRRHWAQAADLLAATDPAWLDAMITRRVPLADWDTALPRQAGDIKVVIEVEEDA